MLNVHNQKSMTKNSFKKIKYYLCKIKQLYYENQRKGL